MGVNNYVFPSRSEKENYKKLCRQWNSQYSVYHNLPFLNIFNVNGLNDLSDIYNSKPMTLSQIEENRLKKTSVDYTLCDKNDKPLLCIEFDGLQQGFNIGTEYIPQTLGKSNLWRKEITELKLKVAYSSRFPFFVVADQHFEDLSDEVKLTIVDGIIGDILTSKGITEKFKNGFIPEEAGYDSASFDKLPDDEKHEIVQDWAVGLEVEAEMENNPITKKSYELYVNNLDEIISHSEEWLRYPSHEDEARGKGQYFILNEPILNGAKVVLKTKSYGEIKSTVWLPNFKSFGYSGLGMMIHLAKLSCLIQLEKFIKKAN